MPSESSKTVPDDPFSGRDPTSHERMSGRPWDDSYRDGPAPWDIGRPQPAFARLRSEKKLTGPVLDAGCGTGEHTLLFASLGLSVLGIDLAETALVLAREKATARGVTAEFTTADALHLERLGRTFNTVLDSGLFHTFNASERAQYAASLASVTEPGATLYILCFSDEGPDTGPHPISQQDLRTAFHRGTGWTIASIELDRIQTLMHAQGAPAWFATIKRMRMLEPA
jgi:SAM-dependent methyltransferase